MLKNAKRTASIIGIIVGIIIVIIGFSVQSTSTYSIGKSLKFGADFYTEIYDVTKSVGYAINRTINDLICAIGWLIVSLGVIDICFFGYKLACTYAESGNAELESIDKHVQILASKIIKEQEEQAKREAEERSMMEALNHETRAQAAAQRKAEADAKRTAARTAENKEILSKVLAHALMFRTDSGLINNLKNVADWEVQEILGGPAESIREKIQALLDSLK